MDRLIAFLGIFILLLISYSLSNDRKKVDPKIIIWGLSLQFIFAIFVPHFYNTTLLSRFICIR